MSDITTPQDLARDLGISDVKLRTWLRREHPRSASEKNQRWHLTPDHVAAARKHFGRVNLTR